MRKGLKLALFVLVSSVVGISVVVVKDLNAGLLLAIIVVVALYSSIKL